MQQSRPRKPRFKRVADACRIELTQRDLQIVSEVGRHRFLQSHHLALLLRGSPQHLIRRLGKLYHVGLLERPLGQILIRSRVAPSLAYCLTARGRRCLQDSNFESVPSAPRMRATSGGLSLAHALRLSDILVAFRHAAAQNGGSYLSPEDWPGGQAKATASARNFRWPVRIDESLSKRWIIPDGAFALSWHDDEAKYFVLEVDRGTMPVVRRDVHQSSFQRKVALYKETRRQGVLWKMFQVPAFRVLIVAESRHRLASMQRAAAASFKRGDSEMFLFAIASELLTSRSAWDHEWETCSGRKACLLPPSR